MPAPFGIHYTTRTMLNGTGQAYGNTTLQRDYGTDAKVVIERVLLLDDATITIRQQIDRLRDHIGFVRNVADGIFGPNPPRELSSNKLVGTPSSRADGLRSATSELYETISDLGNELDRLRSI